MAFHPNDPRATLEAPPSVATPAAFAEAQYVAFTESNAASSNGSLTWFVRTQNCAVAYSSARADAVLPSAGDASERMIALPDRDSMVHITHAEDEVTLTGSAVMILPAGPTTVTVLKPGPVLQLFTSAAADVIERSINAEQYRSVPPNVAVHAVATERETRIRTYSLADYPATQTRFGSIFRSTNLMLNFINDRVGPRDARLLSPHSHADFEQCSIQVSGRFVHHVRTPWGPDMTQWRDDEHVELDGAAVVIFPPPMVHTSQAVGPGLNRLIDAFSPPREDFLSKRGWVLNADEYDADPLERA